MLGFDWVVVAAGVVVVAVEVDVLVSVVVESVGDELSTVGVFASPGTVSAGAVLGSGSDAFLLPPPHAEINGTTAVSKAAARSRCFKS